jgi:hypothetical protein
MSDYTVSKDYLAIDSLPGNDPGRLLVGSDWDEDFNRIATAIATKANLAGDTITGTMACAALAAVTTVTATGLVSGTRMALSSPVGFYASQASQNPSANPETLVYGSELFDYGAGYDASTGTFTAPVAGLYVLTAGARFVNTVGTGLVRGYFSIRVNGTEIARSNVVLTPSGATANLNFGGLASTVVSLAAGDAVIVRYVAPDSGATFWQLSNLFFSGALLALT